MRYLMATVLLIGLLLTGCGEGTTASPERGDTTTPGTAALPDGLIVAAPIDGAMPIPELKQSARPGDTVVVRGHIGGSKQPFVHGRAAFTIVDVSEPLVCGTEPGDHCETPWDFCCTDREKLTAATASIRVTDVSGRPLKGSINGVAGIKPLARVTLRGEVVQAGDNVLAIKAESIHVE